MDMQLRDMDMQHRHPAWTCSIKHAGEMKHGQSSMGIHHGHAACRHGQATWICSIFMQHGHGACIQHEHAYASLTWKCSMDVDMQHGHGHAA
jgi:hypothetical protein